MDVNTQVFRQMDLFWGMNDQELKLFHDAAAIEKFSAGEVIFHEGDPCDKFYIVLNGAVEITTRLSDGTPKVLGMIYPGAHFGEMALIDDAPRAATAKASEETSVFFILRDRFLDLIAQHPTFSAKALINLARTLSKHLRTTNALLRQSIDWNLKISGAADLSISRMLQENQEVKIVLTTHEELKGTLLRVDKGIFGYEVVLEDKNGEMFFIPAHSIVHMSVFNETTTPPPLHY